MIPGRVHTIWHREAPSLPLSPFDRWKLPQWTPSFTKPSSPQLKAPRLNPETNQLDFIVRPEANELQRQFCTLVHHCLERELPIRVILLKPRQKGCSTISVAFLYWLVRRLGIQGMIIGGQYDQTDELWKILQRYHTYDTFAWPNSGVIQDLKAKYTHGGGISKRTALNENAGRAGTYQAVIVTELGRWKEGGRASAGDVLQGVQATVAQAPNTAVILESTARGNAGVFHEQWQNSISLNEFLSDSWLETGPEIPFVRIFAPAHAFQDSRLPLTPSQRAKLEATLTDDERRRLAEFSQDLGYIAWRRHVLRHECRGNETRLKFDYPDSPEETFHASAPTVFSTLALGRMRDACRGKGGMPGVLREIGAATEDAEEDAPSLDPVFAFEPRELANAEIVLYESPRQGLSYVLAVDPMTGVANDASGRDRDHHCALVLRNGYYDAHSGQWRPAKLVARTRPPSRKPEWACQWGLLKLEEVVFALHRFYGDCLTIVEANRDGGLIRGLWERGCRLYSRDREADHSAGPEKLGFLTVGGKAENTRTWILEQLEDAVARDGEEGEGIEIPDERTLEEMAVFIVTPKGRQEAAPGEHDDSVMALAIAYALRGHGTLYSEPGVMLERPKELTKLGERRRGRMMFS